MTKLEEQVNQLVNELKTPEQQRDALFVALRSLTLDKRGIMPHPTWNAPDVALIVDYIDYSNASALALAIERLMRHG